MPEYDTGMFFKIGCQFCNNIPGLTPIDGRGVAVIMASTDRNACSDGVHAPGFFIFFCQPAGLSRGGSGEKGRDPGSIEPVDDGTEPFQLIQILFRLQISPGKNAERNTVNVCFLHIDNILF